MSLTNVRLGWKSSPGTNTPAFLPDEDSSIITLSIGVNAIKNCYRGCDKIS